MEVKATPLRSDVPASVLDLVDKAAALGIPGSRKIVLRAFDDLVDGIGVGAAAEAAATGSTAPIFELTDVWDEFDATLVSVFDPEDGPLVRTMARAVKDSLGDLAVPGAGLDVADVAAQSEAWLMRNGARLVTNVTGNTRLAITNVVQNAFAGPESVQAAAREIMRIKGFGLTVPQMSSLEKLTAGWMSEGLSPKTIERLGKKAHGAMLRRRARVVAQTEAYNAGHAAQGLLWKEATAEGGLDPGDFVQEWVTRVIRVCPRCQALDGTVAEINGGTFTSRVVEDGSFAGQVIEIAAPTVHPLCFCARRIINREDALEIT